MRMQNQVVNYLKSDLLTLPHSTGWLRMRLGSRLCPAGATQQGALEHCLFLLGRGQKTSSSAGPTNTTQTGNQCPCLLMLKCVENVRLLFSAAPMGPEEVGWRWQFFCSTQLKQGRNYQQDFLSFYLVVLWSEVLCQDNDLL